MRGLNKVILIGNLGKDPEITVGSNTVKRCSFSLATTETYTDKNGQRVDNTEWHNIVLWGNLAEIAEKFLKKGSPIYLEGKIRNRSYEDNGVRKYITEIRGDNFLMLGGKRDDNIDNSSYSSNSTEPLNNIDNKNEPSVDDDLPF